jgi:HAD superfamily hydrolase (TIGR01493 family)
MTHIHRRVVLANGTARLQIDITKSSGLNFDMLLSSELLNLTKPDSAIYHKAIDLLGHRLKECVVVAAHAYDLEAAKKVYVHIALIRDIDCRF